MVYGPFDLSGATAARLEFDYWNQSEVEYDKFWWMASGNNVDFSGYWTSGDSLGWQPVDFALTDWLGDSSVYIAFVFISDGSFVDERALVDDVVLSTQGGATAPPAAFGKALPANGATGVALSPTLSWAASAGAGSLRVLLRHQQRQRLLHLGEHGDGDECRLVGLAYSTTYYWQVRAINLGGVTYANGGATVHWSFTTSGATATREWTYMVYLDGDNNLEDAAVNDFLEMSSVGSTPRWPWSPRWTASSATTPPTTTGPTPAGSTSPPA